jgi:hypothetical protein
MKKRVNANNAGETAQAPAKKRQRLTQPDKKPKDVRETSISDLSPASNVSVPPGAVPASARIYPPPYKKRPYVVDDEDNESANDMEVSDGNVSCISLLFI